MSKIEKLLRKARTSPKNIRFEELVTLLVAFGFVQKRISGSHHIYRHPDFDDLINIQPSNENKAKPYQVRQFIELIDMHELKLDKDD